MKFGVQSSIGAPLAQENFQQGRKGQKPKGYKAKRPKFQKLFTNNMGQTQSPSHGFTSIFKLKGPISWNFALELIVYRPRGLSEKFKKKSLKRLSNSNCKIDKLKQRLSR